MYIHVLAILPEFVWCFVAVMKNARPRTRGQSEDAEKRQFKLLIGRSCWNKTAMFTRSSRQNAYKSVTTSDARCQRVWPSQPQDTTRVNHRPATPRAHVPRARDATCGPIILTDLKSRKPASAAYAPLVPFKSRQPSHRRPIPSHYSSLLANGVNLPVST